MLRFEADSAAARVDGAVLAGLLLIHHIAAIHLKARLVRIDLHEDATGGGIDGSCHLSDITLRIEDPVVVVATGLSELVEVVVDVCADSLGLTEVERGALYLGDARRDELVIDRSIVVRVDGELVIHNRGAWDAGEVEVAVVGEVNHRLLVRRRFVLDVDGIVIRQGISNLDVEVAREASLAVLREVGEFDRLGRRLVSCPHLPVEALGTTVEAVRLVVLGKSVLCPVELELTVGDTVAVATDEGTKVARAVDIGLDAVVSEDDVGHLAVLVGHHDRDEAAAPVGNASLGTFGILEDVEAGRLACDLGFKLGFVQPGEGCFFLRFLLLLFAGT